MFNENALILGSELYVSDMLLKFLENSLIFQQMLLSCPVSSIMVLMSQQSFLLTWLTLMHLLSVSVTFMNEPYIDGYKQ